MPEPTDWLAAQVQARKITAAKPSMAEAGELITQARSHVKSAKAVKDDDPTGAMSLCHKATQKAISAHMIANGYRNTSAEGGHGRLVDYAEVVLPHVIDPSNVPGLRVLRRERNNSDYGHVKAASYKAEDLDAAIVLAEEIVSSIATALADQARS